MDENTNSVLASLVDRLADAGGVESVYGGPVERGDRTVIPVARVSWGFGAGGDASEKENEGEAGDESEESSEGFGMGAGVSASPVGALVITDDGAHFVRYGDRKKLLAAGVLAFAAGWLAGRR